MSSSIPPVPRENPFIGATYGQALRTLAKTFGAREALVFGGRRWTFADVLAEADRAAARLHALGLRAGDKVAIWLPNRPEFLWYWLGAAQSGLVAVVLNTRLTPGEAEYQIGQSDSRAVIVPGDRGFRDFLGDVFALKPSAAITITVRGIVINLPPSLAVFAVFFSGRSFYAKSIPVE